jgi:hypothetical protein
MTFRKLLFCLILLVASPVWSQSVVLEGRVLDAADDSAIAGAQITVRRGNNKLGTGTSLADGGYLVKGLKKGDRIEAYYSRGGYKPNPMPSTVVLANDKNVQDIQLIRDTGEANYWKIVSAKIKAGVESATPDQGKQLQLYEQTWSALGKIGLAPEAQAQAARQLISVAPQAAVSHDLMSFATVDDKDLHKAEANIRAAVHGEASLVYDNSIPSDIAVDIAIDEFKKQPSEKSTQDKFSKNLEAVWGPEAVKQFRTKLNQDCRTTVRSEVSPCPTPNDFRHLEVMVKEKPTEQSD